MKLRNKKTGEIVDLSEGYIQDTHNGESIIIKSVATSYEEGYLYDSLAELNKEWEDYKPVEPLIKDEKIRKIVREWSEVNGFDVLKYLDGSRMCALSYRLKNSDGDVVMELLGDIDGLENCKEYTVTELCGEEDGIFSTIQ